MSTLELLRPTSVGEAVSLLRSRERSRFIAGGQTLVAMINSGLVDAQTLVSLADVAELNVVVEQPDGTLRIGATVPHRNVARHSRLQGERAVLREAASVIAHPAIRNFGTIGGALAHGDPAADYPAAVVAANASIEVAHAGGRRVIPAEEFFVDYLTTALEPGELVTAVILPPVTGGSAGHYLKFSRVDGDYAIVSIAVTLQARAGICSAARIAVGGCGPTPVFDAAANEALVGSPCDARHIAAAARALAERSDPVDDVRGSASYRRALIARLLERAVRHAWDRAVAPE